MNYGLGCNIASDGRKKKRLFWFYEASAERLIVLNSAYTHSRHQLACDILTAWSRIMACRSMHVGKKTLINEAYVCINYHTLTAPRKEMVIVFCSGALCGSWNGNSLGWLLQGFALTTCLSLGIGPLKERPANKHTIQVQQVLHHKHSTQPELHITLHWFYIDCLFLVLCSMLCIRLPSCYLTSL